MGSRTSRFLPAFALLMIATTTPGYADPWSKDPPSAAQPQTTPGQDAKEQRQLAAANQAAAAPLRPVAVPAPAQAGCLDTPLHTMADSGVAGSAQLCIAAESVRAQVTTSNLAAGNAYTVWFVYFDQPASCKAQPCMPPDAIGDDPAGVLGRMDAVVADTSGASVFAGDLRGLRLSSGSQVHLPIFGHGQANSDDNRARARQLLTPEDPTLGAPGLGVPAAHPQAAPVAVAVFDIP